LILPIAVTIINIAVIITYIFNYNYFFNFNNISLSSSSSSDQQQEREIVKPSLVGLEKNTLKVEDFVARGLSSPTSMAFIDRSNLLVLEKAGQVRLVSNGILQKQPVLTVPVDNESERGLLGIAILKSNGFIDTNTAARASSSSPTITTKVFL
jgi:glucose/arabinose dehydrogenase